MVNCLRWSCYPAASFVSSLRMPSRRNSICLALEIAPPFTTNSEQDEDPESISSDKVSVLSLSKTIFSLPSSIESSLKRLVLIFEVGAARERVEIARGVYFTPIGCPSRFLGGRPRFLGGSFDFLIVLRPLRLLSRSPRNCIASAALRPSAGG